MYTCIFKGLSTPLKGGTLDPPENQGVFIQVYDERNVCIPSRIYPR